MDILTIVLCGLGLLALVAGTIMLLFAAFSENLWWGLATLFLPVAGLIFAIMHWSRAKMAVYVHLVGAALMVGGVAASPSVQMLLKGGLPASLAEFSSEKAPPRDLNADIQQKRDQVAEWELKFRQDSVTLTQKFQALQAKRTSLKPGDDASVAAFNQEAEAYKTETTALRDLKSRLDLASQELEALLDERSRASAAGNAPGADGKNVVMYTTASCPACKAAKAYFARRGIKYDERNVDSNSAFRQEFDQLGGRGVPLILVGKEKMEGFSEQRLNQLL